MSLSPSPFLTIPSLTAATRTALSPAAVSAGNLGLYRRRRTLRSAATAIAITIDLAAIGEDIPEDYGSMFLAKNLIRRRRAGVLHHPPRCRGRTGSEISAARPSSSCTGSTSPAALCGRFFHFPRQGGSRMSMDRRMQASFQMRRYRWRAGFALDTGGGEDSANAGGTRLGTIVGGLARQVLEKLNGTRKNFPTKIFLLLLGFYTANALATILGQTGDWDVLVAGVVVAAIEGIGALMYRKPFAIPLGRLHSLIVMVNYWKAGVCLGLFVDAFKLGS